MGSFYVYELVDPRDGATFYVGKGKGARMHAHLRQVRRGLVENRAKHDRIALILAEGLLPLAVVVAEFCYEQDAIDREAALIKFYGIENLTNQRECGAVQCESIEDSLRDIIKLARLDMRSPRPEVAEFGREFEETGLALLAQFQNRIAPCRI